MGSYPPLPSLWPAGSSCSSCQLLDLLTIDKDGLSASFSDLINNSTTTLLSLALAILRISIVFPPTIKTVPYSHPRPLRTRTPSRHSTPPHLRILAR